ncbi:MAG TPA: hypothetical protein VLW55_11920 [Burkholderiaceae bacterium]|nr:hypothetical protein [Burkholderiaceae bacterium]
MKAKSIRTVVSITAVGIAFVCAQSARADDEQSHKLGDHPAVVVKRLEKTAGYDYASKFYPHPAWLHLYAEQPNDAVQLAAHGKDASKPAAPSILSAAGTRSPRIE